MQGEGIVGETSTRLDIIVLGSAASPHDATRTAVFARMGHRVAMISIAQADIPGVRLLPVTGDGIRFRPLRRVALMLATAVRLLGRSADIWHAHYAGEYGTWAAALLRRRPLVITVMGGDVLFDEQGNQGRLARALTRHALRQADLVLVKSNALGDVVAGFGVPRERIMRVIWGIDLERFVPDPADAARLRTEWGADGRSVLLAPRMLQPFYNHHLLIDALPAVIDAGHDPIVVFATKGQDPAYRASIEARAAGLGLADRLRFSPPRPQEAMATLYAAADVVVSLAPSDGMPQTPIEAGAAGRPTVMTRLERYRELFTDGSDVLMTELDPAEIATCISRLLGDRDLRQSIADGARRVMEEHAELSQEACRVEQRYYDLVAERRRKVR
jgi:glycosyltransferase involved in cell wall biosynthesis